MKLLDLIPDTDVLISFEPDEVGLQKPNCAQRFMQSCSLALAVEFGLSQCRCVLALQP